LFVSKSNARRWVFRYNIAGKTREMGLGSLNDVSLKKARELAAECRALRVDGKDPISVRPGKAVITFDECGEKYITAHESGWVG